MVNVSEFEAIKKMFTEAKTEEQYTEINDTYCGPSTGIWYNKDTKEIVVANGWTIDDDGNVIKE